jgi:hypothetical protein
MSKSGRHRRIAGRNACTNVPILGQLVKPPALITGPGPRGGPHLKLLTDELALLDEFYAYNPWVLRGIFVAGSVRGGASDG